MNQSDDPSRDYEQKCAVRAVWLAKVSVVLAIVMELPAGGEASLIYGRFWTESISFLVAVKVTCLSLILLPFVIYVVLNGLRALGCVRGHVTVVALIAAISLTHNP